VLCIFFVMFFFRDLHYADAHLLFFGQAACEVRGIVYFCPFMFGVRGLFHAGVHLLLLLRYYSQA